MFNVGGGEVLVILLVALLVLGPGKLPDAARQVGKVLTQVRQVSTGFQKELKSALDETVDPPSPAADGARPIDGPAEPDSPDDSAPVAADDDTTTTDS